MKKIDAEQNTEDRSSAGQAEFAREEETLAADGAESPACGGEGASDLALSAEERKKVSDKIRLKRNAGINDTSERGDPPHMASTEEFFASYRTLLQTAREYTPQLLVIEPFFILKDTGMDGARNALIDRIYSIRRLAAAFHAAYVPMNGIFAEYGVSFGAERYTTDCVHLTAEGNALLAEEWLKRAERI